MGCFLSFGLIFFEVLSSSALNPCALHHLFELSFVPVTEMSSLELSPTLDLLDAETLKGKVDSACKSILERTVICKCPKL